MLAHKSDGYGVHVLSLAVFSCRAMLSVDDLETINKKEPPVRISDVSPSHPSRNPQQRALNSSLFATGAPSHPSAAIVFILTFRHLPP